MWTGVGGARELVAPAAMVADNGPIDEPSVNAPSPRRTVRKRATRVAKPKPATA
ncbi:MAG: hypothetical protein NVS3B12_31670 [Acidimicrobiales bacterium]